MGFHNFKHPRQSDVVHVEPVDTPQQMESFLRFPWQIYRDDPYWVPPYLSQIRKRLDIRQNPFFKNADRQLFCAYWNGKLVGTIAGIVNHQHNHQLQEHTGFFGFFETINDRHVASALINAVVGWLTPQNIHCLRGPVNGAPTDEVGVLICGHESWPALWEGHTPRYYQMLLEDQGFEKYDDAFAYEITYQDLGNTLNGLPPKLRRIAQNGSAHPLLEIRSTNNKNWNQDILDAHYVYNTAFRTIQGHIDMSLEKFQQMVNASKGLMDLDLTLIAKVGNVPVGFAVALPDINEALRHFDGEVSKWEIPRFYWHKWHIRTACFKLLGVLPEYRGRGIEAQIMYEMAQRIVSKKYDRVEMSLASEKNIPMNRIIRRMGGRLYRAYRIYQRTI
jgi:GNAT superfamily N-acetyltransferase